LWWKNIVMNLFEHTKTRLDAVVSQSGISGIFKLREVDVFEFLIAVYYGTGTPIDFSELAQI